MAKMLKVVNAHEMKKKSWVCQQRIEKTFGKK